MKKVLATLVVAVLTLAACGYSTNTTAQDQAQKKADNAQIYVPKNDIELKNYNQRMKIADDPTTILWCTSSFNTPASPLFTIPIIGKLTSGSKRPYSTSITKTGDYTYSPELPGPDGMFGTSGEYRYGFSPTGVYSDFYNIPTYCTTEPTIWQRQSTSLVLESDPTLLAAQQQAQALIKAGDSAGAQKVLEDAIRKVAK